MKNFLLNHPFISSLIVFLIVLLGGSLVGIVFGLLMMGECKPVSASDPCDAGALAAAAIWSVSFVASFILGIVASILTSVIIMFMSKGRVVSQ